MRRVAEGLLIAGALLLAWVRVGAVVLPIPSTLWLLVFGVAHLLLGLGLVCEVLVAMRWGWRYVMRRDG